MQKSQSKKSEWRSTLFFLLQAGDIPTDMLEQIPKNAGGKVVQTNTNGECRVWIDARHHTLQTVFRMVATNNGQVGGNGVNDASDGELAHYFSLVLVARLMNYTILSSAVKLRLEKKNRIYKLLSRKGLRVSGRRLP